MRHAFTLVELLVAIVVFTIGLLALAATAGIVAAHVGDGGRLTASAHLARTLLDSLGARDCDAVVAGALLRPSATAQWTATRDSAFTRVELTVGSSQRRGTRRDTYQLLVPCVRQ